MNFIDPQQSVASGPISAASSFRALADLDQAGLDALPVAVYLCAADGRVIRFNNRAVELWARVPRMTDPGERFCGSLRLYLPDGTFLPHEECPMASVLATGESIFGQEVIVERPDGDRRSMLVNIAATLDEEGVINGAINCFQDITSRCQREEVLRDSERRVRELIDALPAAIYVTDEHGRITMFNQAAIDFSGRVPELGVDSWCVSWKLFRPDGTPLPHDECPMAVSLREGRAVRGEEAIAERPDGSRIHFEPYPTPIRDKSGKIVGGINMLVDITDRKKAEEQRQLLLREMNHRAKNFIAVASGLVTLCAKHATTKDELATSVRDRLDALLRAHELVRPAIVDKMLSDRAAATLHSLISAIFAPYAELPTGSHEQRYLANGPAVDIGGHSATGLALLFHELVTNAAKYGAFASELGRIEVSWSLDDDELRLLWKESGGPAIESPPATEGFGTHLSRMTISGQLGGKLVREWRREGLLLDLSVPVAKLHH